MSMSSLDYIVTSLALAVLIWETREYRKEAKRQREFYDEHLKYWRGEDPHTKAIEEREKAK